VRRAVGSELTAALQYAGRLITATAKNFNSAADAGLKLAKDESNAGANWLKQIVQADRQRSDAGVQARTAQLPRAAAEDAKIGVGRMRVAVDQVNRDSQENIRILVAQSLVAFANLSTLPTLAIPTIASRLSAFGNWLYNDGLDHATNFVTGIADTISFGGTRKYREYFGMDYVDYNSWMYMGGTLVGTAIGVGLGGGAGGICNGGRLILAARTYTQVSTFVGMAQVAYKWRNGEPIGVTDALAFAPAAGWAVGRVGKALGAWGCFVGETQVVRGWDNTPIIASPEYSLDEEWSWEWAALGAGAGIAAVIVRKRRKQNEDGLLLDAYFAQDYLEDRNRGLFDGTPNPTVWPRPRREAPAMDLKPRENVSASAAPAATAQPLRSSSPCRSASRESTTRRAPAASRTFSKWLAPLLVLLSLACFWQAVPRSERPGAPEAKAAVATVGTTSPTTPESTRRLVTTAIKDLRTGQRVLVNAPRLATDEEPQITIDDPSKWRDYLLRLPKPDGSVADITLLETADWLDFASDDGGKTVELNLPELGAEGLATVVDIRPCPPIESSNSDHRPLITGTFRHTSNNVVDVLVSGIDEPIGATANHPFWSEDRQTFVPAGELRPGERLLSMNGSETYVRSITRRSGEFEVHNVQIDGFHAYHVAASGVFVHNTCAGQHHFWPASWGNRIPFGDKMLPYLNKREHTHIHKKLSDFLEQTTGFRFRSMSGARWQDELGSAGMRETLDSFYRDYSRSAAGQRLKEKFGKSVYQMYKDQLRYAIDNGYLTL
jgi:hypothetical protein